MIFYVLSLQLIICNTAILYPFIVIKLNLRICLSSILQAVRFCSVTFSESQ